jgi:surface antigen
LVSALRLEMQERDALEKRFRQVQALQMNDAVVQDLAVAKYSLDRDDTDQAREALGRALEGSKEIVATLITKDGPMKPGDLTAPPPS